jgi:hypothetical protein
MSFDGGLLQRGFWIYAWHIRREASEVVYVGRTGDSSSANASSPFRRIGQHLDPSPQAKGNAMARQLRKEGIDPKRCRFEMVAIGPIYPEQNDYVSHVPFRDRMAALERAVADELTLRGYKV